MKKIFRSPSVFEPIKLVLWWAKYFGYFACIACFTVAKSRPALRAAIGVGGLSKQARRAAESLMALQSSAGAAVQSSPRNSADLNIVAEAALSPAGLAYQFPPEIIQGG